MIINFSPAKRVRLSLIHAYTLYPYTKMIHHSKIFLSIKSTTFYETENWVLKLIDFFFPRQDVIYKFIKDCYLTFG